VTPSLSVRADLPVALVEDTVDRRRSREVATAYLRFHYEPEAQRIAARHHFRPHDAAATAALVAPFPDLALLSVQEVAGGWDAANARHFKDRALFDQIFSTP
jgi:sulfate transport system substrate-binding protein